jgi:predicted transposase
MQRTIRIKLEPSPSQAQQLLETNRQYTAVFNAVCARGWCERLSNGVKLHHATYYLLKADYPNLVSDLHLQARVKATEAVKSALARVKAGRKVSQPHSDACPPRYNVHTYRVDWESRTVRLSLVSGRQTIRFHIPDYSVKYAGYPTDTADLTLCDGVWWLHVVVTVPAPEVETTAQVVGVELGLSRHAVTSTNRFLGKRAWKAVEGRLFRLKRALQKRGTSVGIRPATTAVPAISLCAGCVACRCTLTSMGRVISRRSTVPRAVHPPSVGCLSTSPPGPIRRFGVRVEVQAVTFTRQLLTDFRNASCYDAQYRTLTLCNLLCTSSVAISSAQALSLEVWPGRGWSRRWGRPSRRTRLRRFATPEEGCMASLTTTVGLIACLFVALLVVGMIGFVTLLKAGVIVRHAARPREVDRGSYSLSQGREVRSEAEPREERR